MPFHRTTVLVVDDDAQMRGVVEALGHSAGFDVRLAASGKEAIERLKACPELDAIVSDIVMPGMSGLELARRVRTLRPRVAILLMTGHPGLLEEVLQSGAVPLIKPFELENFEFAVREAIDAQFRD